MRVKSLLKNFLGLKAYSKMLKKFKVDLKPPAMLLMKMPGTVATFNDFYDQCVRPASLLLLTFRN